MNTLPLLRPMSLGEVLDAAFNLYRRQFRTLFLIAALVQAPVIMLSLPISFFSMEFLTPDFASDPSVLGPLAGLMAAGWCIALLSAAGTILQTGALIFASSEQFHGRTTTVRRAYRETLRRGASLLVCTLLLGGAVLFLGVCSVALCLLPLLLLVPLAVRWLFAYQAVMLEGADGVAGLRSSWHLVTGRFWRTLGFAVVLGMMSYVVGFGPGLLATLLGAVIPEPRVANAIGNAGGSIIALILTPVIAGASTLYYYDLRMRQQGYDLYLQAQEIARAAAETGAQLEGRMRGAGTANPHRLGGDAR